jgi:hypothetical protein
MGIGDGLSTVGGGPELVAMFKGGATVFGVSALTAGMVLGGLGISVSSGVSFYRAAKAGNVPGMIFGGIGVAAGLMIVGGAIGFFPPLVLVAGVGLALFVGGYHLGRFVRGL